MQGKVYLVGAGPGRVEYLTLRGQQLLQQADVIIYDALVDSQLLSLSGQGCLYLDVGKRGGRPSVSQPEINRLLVEACQQGKQVVRLKSGDPLVFGRGISEIEALQAANCDLEVIPGLSSALAAPLLAGIPLTHPELSRCFTVLTAHAPEQLEWRALARMETLVILMAGQRLPEIILHLQDYGRSPQTPVAVVRWAGRPEQTIWRGSLADIVAKTAGEDLSPAVVIVGQVAGLSLLPPVKPAQLDLTQPLSGKTVLVTRALEQSSQFSDRLRAIGANVLEMPALQIGPPSSWAGLDQAIANLSQFDWLILTSANGVEAFMERLLAQGKDARSLFGVQIAVVGRKTANCLTQKGLKPDFIPPDFVADSLVAHFPDYEHLAGMKILFPRVETGGRETLVAEFRAQGAEVTEVPAYQSGCPPELDPQILVALQQRVIQVITFASSKTVQNFCQLIGQSAGPDWQNWLTEVCLASIGPQTSQTCCQLFGRVEIEATEYTLEGLTQAIADYYGHPQAVS
jgi:uroporphyrinogen III methyltransferase / synthase